ncbi:MAG TPA: hypothetical protein VGC91_07975 [Pyrinomonadaceae bacterium]|jgi:hypothetical protein
MIGQAELDDLLKIETELRGFIEYFDHCAKQAEDRGTRFHPFAPGTIEMVEKLRPVLKQLDETRAEAFEQTKAPESVPKRRTFRG